MRCGQQSAHASLLAHRRPRFAVARFVVMAQLHAHRGAPDPEDPCTSFVPLIRLVQNIVKSSAPEPTRAEGISDIEAALDYGLSRGEVIYNVFGNLATRPLTDPAWPAKWGGTAKQFQNQLTVARYLTEVLEVKTTDMSWLCAAIADITPDTDVSTVDKIVQIIGTPPPGG